MYNLSHHPTAPALVHANQSIAGKHISFCHMQEPIRRRGSRKHLSQFWDCTLLIIRSPWPTGKLVILKLSTIDDEKKTRDSQRVDSSKPSTTRSQVSQLSSNPLFGAIHDHCRRYTQTLAEPQWTVEFCHFTPSESV